MMPVLRPEQLKGEIGGLRHFLAFRPAQELYNFTVWIAESPPEFKDEAVMAIEKFLRFHPVGRQD